MLSRCPSWRHQHCRSLIKKGAVSLWGAGVRWTCNLAASIIVFFTTLEKPMKVLSDLPHHNISPFSISPGAYLLQMSVCVRAQKRLWQQNISLSFNLFLNQSNRSQRICSLAFPNWNRLFFQNKLLLHVETMVVSEQLRLESKNFFLNVVFISAAQSFKQFES